MINNLIDGCLKIWNFSSSVEHFIFWRLFHQRLLVSNSRLLGKPEKFPDLVNWNGGTPMLLVSCGRWASGLCECFLCVNLPIMSTWCVINYSWLNVISHLQILGMPSLWKREIRISAPRSQGSSCIKFRNRWIVFFVFNSLISPMHHDPSHLLWGSGSYCFSPVFTIFVSVLH